MKILHHIFFLFLVISILYSCTDDHCNLDTDSLLQTEILVNDTSLISHKYLDSLSIYSPEWPDSIHYWEEGSSNSLYFMLSPESDTTEIIFTSRKATYNDTVYIYYQREFVLLSTECGFVTNFTIDSTAYTTNYIDSIKTPKTAITTYENGHIQIYF